MPINDPTILTSLLKATADALDIPDYAYEDAVIKYEDVGEHLASEDSELIGYAPEIYVQGSFRLGTVVRPIGRNGEYDIDLVCKLAINKENITQKDLKDKVGRRLKSREDLARILTASRRCWTLDYPKEPVMPGFHMDVLPSIPNEERRPTGILLTDTGLTRWQKSNPILYAEWFMSRMQVVFQERKAALAEAISVDIDEVPDWRVKTPLQRSIQLLKRHRDVYFDRDPDNAPVSIILTTLAAHAYNNEEDLFRSLDSIVRGMPAFIENRNGKWWVQNPVDKDENFADKWNEYPRRRIAFLRWLENAQEDFSRVSHSPDLPSALDILSGSIGEGVVNAIAPDFGVSRRSLLPAVINPTPKVPALGDTAHVIRPESQFRIEKDPRYEARVKGTVYLCKHNGKKGRFLRALGESSVPRKIWIKFRVHTNAPEPYTVKWQVTNTGDDAIKKNQLRGGFYSSDDSEQDIRWETTDFRGTHWVKAFILNNEGVCVAESPKLLVKIR